MITDAGQSWPTLQVHDTWTRLSCDGQTKNIPTQKTMQCSLLNKRIDQVSYAMTSTASVQ